MAKKKGQICPYCGLTFIYLSRHKCKLSPNKDGSVSLDEEVKIPSKKLKKKTKKTKKDFSKINEIVLSIVTRKKELFIDELMELLEDQPEIDEKTLKSSLSQLKDKQLISYKLDVKEGFRMGRINYIEEYDFEDKKIQYEKNDQNSWDTLGDCPCFLCPEIKKCNVGNTSISDVIKKENSQINPFYCSHLTNWINCMVSDPPIPYDNPFMGAKYLDKKKKKKKKQ
ncbi:MAG: hypothetical protein ACTSWY_12065 [Promethearchaeota archaeon]